MSFRVSRDDRVTALLLASGGLAAGLGYVWTLMAARFMAPAEYADFTAAASILYFIVMAAAPLSQSVAYFVASSDDAADAIAIASSAERRLLVYGGGAVLILVSLSPLLARALHFRGPLPLAAVFVSAYFFALLSVRRGLVQGQAKFGALAANTVVEITLRLAAMTAVCLWLPQASAGVVTHAAATLIAMLMLPFPRAATGRDLRPVIRYFGSAFGVTAVYAAFLNVDVLLAKLFFSPGDAATYGAASFLGRAAAILVPPFYVFAVPHLVEARNDAPELRRRFVRICARYVALAIAGVVVIALLRRQLIALLLGSAYLAAESLLVPISIAIAIGGLTFICSQLPMAAGRFRFLPSYAAAFGVEVLAVAVWHRTMLQVVFVVIAAQAVALLLLAPHVWSLLFDRGRDR
jgi:O-antigen/teichoic acid export membrane protein